MPVREATFFAGIVDLVRRQRRRLQTHPACVPPAHQTAIKGNRRRVVVRLTPAKLLVLNALPNESEIILDNLFVLD